MSFGTEYWAVKKQHIHKIMSITKMRILRINVETKINEKKLKLK